MSSENLNIDYHKQQLLLKSLNKYRTKVQARAALGISEKQMYTYIEKYKIIKNKEGEYVQLK
jgi:hypothetical protein